jgi:hypothetical protein
MTDWSRLLPYREGKRRSFEELCYQLAAREYEHTGRFTSIDDSGGGDGVEFFLTLPDGTEWGWQAKFFHPDSRLNTSRKRQVRDSLTRSIERHPRLTRWFLCTPTSFTTGDNESELRWWSRLQDQHPDVELVHWGDSELSRLLASPTSTGQRAYFFGDIPLCADWFRSRLDRQLANLRDPFDPKLHAITEADLRLHFLARDGLWRASLRESSRIAEEALEILRVEWAHACSLASRKAFVPAATELLLACEAAVAMLREIADQRDPPTEDSTARLQAAFEQVGTARQTFVWVAVGEFDPKMLEDEHQNPDQPVPGTLQVLIQPGSRSVQVLQYLHQALQTLQDAARQSMHVIGAAGIGKTHGAAHACHAAVAEGRPAILLLGSQFHPDGSLESQIRDQLDVPSRYSWEEFVEALDSYAAACGSPALLVIDALNEAGTPAMWRQRLPGLEESLRNHRHIRLATTCRPSFVKTIWGDPPPDLVQAEGFPLEAIPVVMQQYFARYRLIVDTTLTPPWHFRHPLYLKIFCESEKPGGEAPREVFLGAQTLFSVLERYLVRTSQSLYTKLNRPPSDRFLLKVLGPFCDELWVTGRRTVSFERAMQLLDGSTNPPWEQSLTRALLDEGLLLHADLSETEGEQVGFTYDLLGGYLIALQLLTRTGNAGIGELVGSRPLLDRLAAPEAEHRHPLHEDILRGLAAAFPVVTGHHLVAVARNEVLWNAGLQALFEMDPKWIDDRSVHLVARLFDEPRYRPPLLHLALNTAISPRHPLNFSLWDQLLGTLSMRERDLAWGASVQQTLGFWDWLAQETERACRSERPPPAHTEAKMELAAVALRWLLVSTVHGLRNRATRALFWYGRRHPDALATLTLGSLGINDPYVPERCLAASFGVAMAFRADPAAAIYRGRVLPDLARKLYAAMFAAAARHPSTHALLRDSAAGIMELAAGAHPNLFEPDELARTRPPFPRASGRAHVNTWGHAGDCDREHYRDHNEPISRDLATYVAGELLPDGRRLGPEHPDYEQVIGQLRWRMYDLGYEFDSFGELDVRTDTVVPMPPAFEPKPHVERFGHKYAWIAFCELYGWRCDREVLPAGGEALPRPSGMDLDASFPDPPGDQRAVAHEFLPDRSMPLREWVERGPAPDISSLLVLQELRGKHGPWILLDANIEETDPVSGHAIAFSVRSILTAVHDTFPLAEALASAPPEACARLHPPAELYAYAGETTWRDSFPANPPAEIMVKYSPTGPNQSFRVQFTVREGAWETGEPEIRAHHGIAIIEKRIAERFGLWVRLPSWDFHAPDGGKATVSLLHWALTEKHTSTWIRQDLLEIWMAEQGQALLWTVTGQRKRAVNHPTFISDLDVANRSFAEVHRLADGCALRVQPSPPEPS